MMIHICIIIYGSNNKEIQENQGEPGDPCTILFLLEKGEPSIILYPIRLEKGEPHEHSWLTKNLKFCDIYLENSYFLH